ncbi:MAG: transposase [Geodermatophilaceae bacterium]
MTRLAAQWHDEARAFGTRSLAGTDYVYVWVDGIHRKVRLEQDKVCLLVMIGVRADGTKELITLADGHRESTESWPTCSARASAAGCARRCWPSATAALGFWAAVREVFPTPPSSGEGSTRSPSTGPRGQGQESVWRRSR